MSHFTLIITAAAEAEGSSIDHVLSRDRHQTTSRARAASVWLVFKLQNASFREIAKVFGLKKSAVCHCIETHERRMMVDYDMRTRSERLVERFTQAGERAA